MNDRENSQLEWEETGLPSRVEGEKEAALLRFFHTNPQAALGFSGGVDSAYLLYAAMTAGARVKAYYVKSPFQPQFELEDARRLAEALGADWEILETDPLSDPQVAGNPPNRCYVCKKIIFGRIAEAAQRDGFSLLLDGTNASDDDGDRPGVRALRELAVRSPLRECGLTKGEIRRLSQRAGLFTWDKPAYACLATRIPTGTALTRELLERTERAECALADLGFRDFRVRYLEGRAKLQVTAGQMALALEKRREILEALQPDYTEVLLDLEERDARQ